MKWGDLLKFAKDQPLIETNMFLAEGKDLPNIRVQFSRWVKAGRLIKVKNGAYILAEEYRLLPPPLDYIGTLICRPSYISLAHALHDYGLIPEAVPNITLVTTKRPHRTFLEKKLLIYSHVKKELFWGYETRGKKEMPVFFATPEKALLDHFYFTPAGITQRFLDEMRLQNTEILDLKKLMEYAQKYKSPKILKAAQNVCKFAEKERELKEL